MFRSLDGPLEQTPAQRVAGGVQVGGAFLSTRYALRDARTILQRSYSFASKNIGNNDGTGGW